MPRKKHLSHGAPPGSAIIKRGEFFEVVFSRRGHRIATFGETPTEATSKAWRFWRVGGNRAAHFSNLLANALE